MSTTLAIQFCELCEKPFHQEIAYKRHVTYCQKQKHRQKTRRRSCRACKIAKAKCDTVGGSECERCKRKGIICTFDKKSKTSALIQDLLQVAPPQSVDAVTSGSRRDLQIVAINESPAVSAISGFISPVVPVHEELAVLDFNILDSGMSSTGISNFPDHSSTILPHISSPKSPSNHRSHLLPQPYHLNIEPNQDWSRIFRLEPWSSALLPNAIDKWVLRPAPMPTPTSQSHSTRVIRMLRSIPRMMTRRETFPPFVHPYWRHDLPEPLANCMTIARMFCARDTSNSALVWRTIQLEQERLARGLYDFSAAELLAALQSYLVYMIMRVDDETGGTAGDVPMLISFKAMSDWCFHIFGSVPPRPDTEYDPAMTWETWVFRESKRRCALLYFLVSRVFTIFTDNVCPCTSMPTRLPLPAPRTVWEARTELSWSMAYQDLSQRERLATFGDLVEEMRVSTEKLDEWHCGMDYLGLLLESATGIF